MSKRTPSTILAAGSNLADRSALSVHRGVFLVATLMLGIGIIGVGCFPTVPKAKVDEFAVRPLFICSGKMVNVGWETTAETTILDADPEVDPPFNPDNGMEVDNTGQTTREVDGTTEFSITATLGDSTDSEDETVKVVPPGGIDFTIGTQGTCVAGNPIPQWFKAVAPDEWDEAVSLNTVANATTQPISVAHAGNVVTIPSFGSTAAFAGQPVGGDWHLAPAAITQFCPLGGPLEGGELPPTLPFLSIVANAVCQ